MPDRYGPTEPWPEHEKTWWRDAFVVARQAGWWLDHNPGSSAHSFGRLVCRPVDERADGCCRQLVDKTADGAESVARDFPRMVRRCPHVKAIDEGPAAAIALARQHLGNARQLLDAVGRLMDRQDEVNGAVDVLLENVDQAAADAERALERALEVELTAQQRVDAAESDLSGLLARRADAGTGLQVAQTHLTEASGQLADLEPRPQALWDELTALRELASDCRTRLASRR